MEYVSQHRPVTMARHGVVAAPHYLSAQAGLDMLKAGGNAIDAAIAANAMLQVVYPFVCGLGGDLFMIVFDAATQQTYGLNASGRAPESATVERYQQLGYTSMPQSGIHTVTIPGCVDGWNLASQRFGKLGLSRSLASAIAYAEEGFPVGPGLHSAMTRMSQLATTHRSWHSNFIPTGTVPAVGSIIRFPQLANTFRTIANDGADAFYRGSIANQIAEFFAAENGLITLADLAKHHGEWVEPLHVRFAGYDLLELPPNTQGVTALQMLGMLDELTLGTDPFDPQTIHLAVEVKKLAFADRDAHLTDPAYMKIDPAALIAPEYLKQRRSLINPDIASPTLAPSGFSGDTIYLCAADEQGNVVSLIQSNYMGFGSGVVVDGTGIALQNRGAYFSLNPQAANVLAPNKRTLHTLIPSMALQNGQPAVAFGSMGGDGQAQTHLQVYTNLLKYSMNIQQSIEMPRWVHGTAAGSQGEVLQMESRFPAATIADLRRRGHTVSEIIPWSAGMGYAQGIVIDPLTHVLHGGSDPRAEGIAAGW